jgi:hypothetical protein
MAEEIARIEEEIRSTPYNKATQHHIGKLKAKLARLREEEEKSKTRGKKRGKGLRKEGDGTVIIMPGPTKIFDSLATSFKDGEIRVGMMEHRGAKVQLLELSEKLRLTRKSDFFSNVRMADLLLFVLDDGSGVDLDELYANGIRINQEPPKIRVKKRGSGGLRITSAVPQSLKKEEIEDIAKEFYTNADIVLYENLTYERLIDGLAGNRAFIPLIFVRSHPYEEIPREPEKVKDEIIEKLNLITIYLKDSSGATNPLIVKNGDRVRDVCAEVHTDFRKSFKYAILEGPNTKYSGQRIGLSYELKEGDIISIKTRVR